MTKSEYELTLRYCYLRCTPQENKCNNCRYLEIFKEIYDE